MDCPYCGKPMEAGRIPGVDRFLCVPWIPAERKAGAMLPAKATLLDWGGLILRDKPFPAVPYNAVPAGRASFPSPARQAILTATDPHQPRRRIPHDRFSRAH